MYKTIILVLVCLGMFVLQGFVGTNLFILDRSLMFEQPWRIITSIFAHSGIVHFLMNIFALGLFGLILEARIGGKKLLWLFITSGILINLVMPYQRSLGASGAIYAILGSLVILRPWLMVWVGGVPMPMVLAGIVWAFQDGIGVFIPDGVGNLAHLGGLFIGLVMGIKWKKKYGDKKEKKFYDQRLERELDEWERKYMN